MKKLVILVLFLLALNFASCLEIEMKENFLQGETVYAKIKGEVIENIMPEQIYFYRGHVQVPALLDIAKINNQYMIYALLPVQEKEYTLTIKDVWLKENNAVIKKDIEKNFSVSGNKSFSVFPGFIFAQQDFSIKLENFRDEDINLDLEYANKEENLTLEANEDKKIFFQVENLTEIKISSSLLTYSIPVTITKKLEQEEQGRLKRLATWPKEISATIKKDENWQFKFWITNLGEENLSDISFSCDEILKDLIILQPEKIDFLPSLASQQINLTIKTEEGIENQTLTIFSSGASTLILINLKITENVSELNYSSALAEEKSCLEMSGVVCSFGEKCSEQEIYTTEGSCCIGKCEKQETGSNWWIGLLIIVALVVIVGFFYYKFKKPKERNLLKERSKKYEEKIFPKSKPTEGSLTRF